VSNILEARQELARAEVVADGEDELVLPGRDVTERVASVLVSRGYRDHLPVAASQLQSHARRGAPGDRVEHVGREAHSASSKRKRAIFAISPSAVSISSAREFSSRASALARIESGDECSRTQTTNGIPNFSR